MNFEDYRMVQSAAKAVHERIADFIGPDSTEQTIVDLSIRLLSEQGITETWYHNVPAFVLLGSRSCLSISGKDYSPSNEPVGETNLVTIDLSPMLGTTWGDCARSYYIESGRCTTEPSFSEFQDGEHAEVQLHQAMTDFVTPETRFCDLYEYGNDLIHSLGFENLDFLGNLGHSIELAPSDRRFIDRSCEEALGDVNFFTFEPHIRKSSGVWGFKHEEIYYFNEQGSAVAL
ncbi:MAG: M24 family metallopeptidase [Halioglobus sp.]|nr:M24 family metallopeptidase [Halioglobus sp.]